MYCNSIVINYNVLQFDCAVFSCTVILLDCILLLCYYIEIYQKLILNLTKRHPSRQCIGSPIQWSWVQFPSTFLRPSGTSLTCESTILGSILAGNRFVPTFYLLNAYCLSTLSSTDNATQCC